MINARHNQARTLGAFDEKKNVAATVSYRMLDGGVSQKETTIIHKNVIEKSQNQYTMARHMQKDTYVRYRFLWNNDFH